MQIAGVKFLQGVGGNTLWDRHHNMGCLTEQLTNYIWHSLSCEGNSHITNKPHSIILMEIQKYWKNIKYNLELQNLNHEFGDIIKLHLETYFWHNLLIYNHHVQIATMLNFTGGHHRNEYNA
jgi:hypothetical protein